MSRKRIIWIASPFLLLLVLLLGATILIKQILTPEFIVSQMESALNLRAEVGSIHVGLFSSLSSVSITGVRMGERDHFANEGLPLAKRTSMKHPVISVDAIDLSFSLPALLHRKVVVKRFTLEHPELNLIVYKNGNNLSSLFRSPAIVNGKPVPVSKSAGKEAAKKEELKKKEKDSKGEKDEKPFTVQDLPIAGELKRIGIENGSIRIEIKESDLTMVLSSLDAVLDSLDLDPANLKEHNSARVSLRTVMQILSSKGGDAAKITLSANGTIQPLFDPVTGKPNDSILLHLALKKGSFISGFAVADRLSGSLKPLKGIGFSSDKLAQKAELQKDVSTSIRAGGGKVIFAEDVTLPTTNYTLSLNQKSEINYLNNQHLFTGALSPSDEESKRILERMDAHIQKELKGNNEITPQQVHEAILGKMLHDGRVELGFRSTGDIRKPDVTLTQSMPSISEAIASLAGGAAKGALKKKAGAELEKALQKKGIGGDKAKKAQDLLKGNLDSFLK